MEGEPFKADDLSVLLAHYVEAEISKRPGLNETLRERAIEPEGAHIIEQQILELLMEKRPFLMERIPVTPDTMLADILSDRGYLKRIAEIAVERLRGGPEAPALRIAPKPLTRYNIKEALEEGLNFGLIFGAESIYFQDTVLAFQADEARSRSQQARKVNVLGVHVGWLTESGEATRSLLVDKTGLVKEAQFEEAIPLHVVQTLHLPRIGEILLHQQVSQLFENKGIGQINPYGASARASDKAWTHQLWEQCPGNKILSPASQLIVRTSTVQEALTTLRTFIEKVGGRQGLRVLGVVLQPNKGTEGYMVEGFEVAPAKIYEIDEDHLAVQHLMAILKEDDALLREERGNVRFYSDETPEERNRGYRRVALRVNVTWDGSGFFAESGYAQVSKDAQTFAASRGRGGSIVDIDEALLNLYYPRDGAWARLIPTEVDIARIKQAAVNALQALNTGLLEKDYLKMAGIDLVLEVEDAEEERRIQPVVLEANPRPAGLSHLREIREIWGEKPKPMISTALFNAIRLLANRTT